MQYGLMMLSSREPISRFATIARRRPVDTPARAWHHAGPGVAVARP